jgi:hypothetical protein
LRTVLMTEDGREEIQLLDGALVWPPLSEYGLPTPQPLPLKPRDGSMSPENYEVLVGPTTIRLVSAKCACSDALRLARKNDRAG